MKVTMGLDGVIVLDGDDVNEIASFVLALRGDSSAPAKKRKVETQSVEEVPLSAALTDTWNYLVARDNVGGVATSAIAYGTNTSAATVVNRLNTLIEKGLAHRVKRGHYRPGEASR